MALPAGRHHVPIQEEHYLALRVDVVEPVALSDVQNHVPIQEEHHLAMGKFSLKFELVSNSILTYLKVEPCMRIQLKLWPYLLASTMFLSKKSVTLP